MDFAQWSSSMGEGLPPTGLLCLVFSIDSKIYIYLVVLLLLLGFKQGSLKLLVGESSIPVLICVSHPDGHLDIIIDMRPGHNYRKTKLVEKLHFLFRISSVKACRPSSPPEIYSVTKE